MILKIVDVDPWFSITHTSELIVDVLGVDESPAQEAACKAEHALGSEIVERLLGFVEFVGSRNDNGLDLAGEFRRFCEKADSGPKGSEK